jgi:hypothetical protein
MVFSSNVQLHNLLIPSTVGGLHKEGEDAT